MLNEARLEESRTQVRQIEPVLINSGRGERWSVARQNGNTADAPREIILYASYAKAEQAKTDVVKKQAVPMFTSKVKAIADDTGMGENTKQRIGT